MSKGSGRPLKPHTFRLRRHRYLGKLCTVSSVALDGLKFVVPGWCPGPDDGSLAETNSNCHGQGVMQSYTWLD